MGGQFCITVEGIDDLGDPHVFTTSLDCASDEEATDFCGFVLFSSKEAPVVEDVEYNSIAQTAGIDWDQKILSIGPLP